MAPHSSLTPGIQATHETALLPSFPGALGPRICPVSIDFPQFSRALSLEKEGRGSEARNIQFPTAGGRVMRVLSRHRHRHHHGICHQRNGGGNGGEKGNGNGTGRGSRFRVMFKIAWWRKLGISLGSRDAPTWYRGAELLLSVVAITSFSTTAFCPVLANLLFLPSIEKLVVGIFFADFCFKFWAHRLNPKWIMHWSNTSELMSWIPIIDLLVFKSCTGLGTSHTGAFVVLFRMFRLLRFARTYTDTFTLGIRISLVFLTLLAVVTNTASLLWLVEKDLNPEINIPLDTFFFSLCLLTSEGPLFPLVTTKGKLVSMGAILVGLTAIVPQLADAFIAVSNTRSKAVQNDRERAFWAGLIRQVDKLEIKNLIPEDKATKLRQLAIDRDPPLEILWEANKEQNETNQSHKMNVFVDNRIALELAQQKLLASEDESEDDLDEKAPEETESEKSGKSQSAKAESTPGDPGSHPRQRNPLQRDN